MITSSNDQSITVTVNVASNASSPQVNQVSITGAGSSQANASDSTTITAAGSGAGVYYYLQDQIGSTRVITDSSGNVCYDADFYPYGGERVVMDVCPQNYKFTGKERDSESNLDNFGARYDSSAMGRFMSPDPGNAGADPSNPQSWNMYSYVINNPLTFTDPTGMSLDDLDSDEYCDMFDCYGVGLWIGIGLIGPIGPLAPVYTAPNVGPGPGGGSADPTNNPFSGETFGIPNGIQLPTDLASLILPVDPACEFVDCGVSGFTSGNGDSPDWNIDLACSNTIDPVGCILMFSPKPQAPTTPTIGPSNQKGIPPDPLACSPYLDGTGAGQILFNLCSKVFPNGPWSNCVRGQLLNQYVPNGNPLQLTWYLVADHPYDFATCGVQ